MDEGDTCRICRTGAEDDARLYHPCKCSGSIAKVHQDCLIEWLQHSKKKSCELCNTELRFHKLYSSSMPTKLPLYLYLRQLVLQTFVYVRMTLRAVLVAIAWLAILPLLNIHAWRGYISIVDFMVWGLTGAPPRMTNASLSNMENHTEIVAINTTTSITIPSEAVNAANSSSNSTEGDGIHMVALPFTRIITRIIGTTDYKLFFDGLAHNTFEGQMLTCAVVVLFVALFLLREWCLQNLPQHVEGLDFAPAPPVQPAAEEAQRVAPFPLEQAEIEAEAPAPATETLASGRETVAEVRHDAQGPATEAQTSEMDEFVSVEHLRARRSQWLETQFSHTALPTSSSGMAAESLVPTYGATETNPSLKGKERLLDNEENELPFENFHPSSSNEKGKGRAFDLDSTSHRVETTLEKANGGGGSYEEDSSKKAIDFVADSRGSPSSEQDASPTMRTTIADQGSDISDSAIIDDDNDEDDEDDEEDERDEEREDFVDQIDQVEGGDRDPRLGVLGDMAPLARQAEPIGQAPPPRPFEGRFGAQNNGAAPNGDVGDLGDWEEELENGERLEDDLEGMMEAIGMRGPFANLITNMTMMFVLCSFILTIFVALPYMIGKVLGVGHNFARLARIPIRLCRFGLTFFFDKTKLNQVDHARYLVLPFGDSLLRKESSADFMGSLFRIIRRLRWQDARVAPLSYKDALRIAILSLGASLGEAFNAGTDYLSTTIDAMHVRTQGTSTFDRAFCIGLGYFYWLIGLAIQSYLTDLYVRWNMRALKSFVDQQLVVLKVLAFILLELVIFPLGCGLLTDFSLHPLWHDTTITSRLLMIQSRPLSVSFTLWSSGTLYMFALAQFVSQTRSIVRPGVLCFIRDAGDPNFHPIKDILDRRSLEQLRKIGISGIIYSSILLLTLGACTRLIAITTKDVLPLTWQAHRSLTSSGIELCSIAILMPIAIRSWFPSHLVRRSTRRWWKFMAHQLRITAFLLGGRAPDEELTRPWPTWSALWGYGVNTNEARPSGGYARVPADDQAIMTSPLVIRTNVKGVAIDDRGAEAIRAQEEAIKKMTKKPHYAVVFMPPHFRVRIILLVVSLWLTICAILLLGFLPSLIVGRSTLTILGFRTGTEPVHDGYAWFVGCAVIGSSHTLGAKAQRMYLKLRTSSNAVRRFGKHANRFAQRTAFVIAFGLITSTMLGLCVESYLNGLTRALVGDARMPSLSLLHVWTMGLMEQQLLFEIVRELYGRNQRPNFETETFATSLRSVYALLELQNGGWRRPKAMILFKKAFLPSVSLYLAVLALPLLALRLLRAAIGDVEQTQVARSVQVSSVYLVCVLYIFSGSIVRTVARRMDSWTDVIKDEHFLISTELKDYDSAEANDDQAAAEGRENAVQDARLNAEGPIPDVLLNAGGA